MHSSHDCPQKVRARWEATSKSILSGGGRAAKTITMFTDGQYFAPSTIIHSLFLLSTGVAHVPQLEPG